MKLALGVLALLFAGSLGAQTVNVIELTPSDAVRAKSAYEEYKSAEATWNKVNAEILGKYKDGSWMEFSRDFKFLGPKQSGGWTNGITAYTCPSCTSCLTIGGTR